VDIGPVRSPAIARNCDAFTSSWIKGRPPKLRSQRDINLWRIPLQLSLAAVALFAITLIQDILDQYGVIHIPS
jgi:hypothetical protein